uniref:Uncharacterized protein n=1 Tax=Myoviridae sp. ctLnO19 TaxID=2825085 RepID=A0A8S5P1I5_9CAUD|nr:MAG TPA: hypothetical protein [Myoviridae sp. ctLnO19]DAJ69000.1 MAG TPA: hypothetical protein [Caudoviricetes sp.]
MLFAFSSPYFIGASKQYLHKQNTTLLPLIG